MTPKQWAVECHNRIVLAGAEASATEVVEVIVTEAIAEDRKLAKDGLFGLLKKCEEIVDDDLEERPARHSLGRLHAELVRALKELVPPGACLRCRGKGTEEMQTGDERLTWPCPSCKQRELARKADKACQGCGGTGIVGVNPSFKSLACACTMTSSPVVKK